MNIDDLEHLEVVSLEINITGGSAIAQSVRHIYARGPNLALGVGESSLLAISINGVTIAKSYSSTLARAE